MRLNREALLDLLVRQASTPELERIRETYSHLGGVALKLTRLRAEFNRFLAIIGGTTPDILGGGKTIVDVGPGICCFMFMMKALGNSVQGEDLDLTATAAMPLYKTIAEHWKLPVTYHGFQHYLTDPSTFPYEEGTIDLFFFSQSMDGIVIKNGGQVDHTLQQAVSLLKSACKQGGRVLLVHNKNHLFTPIKQALHSCPSGFTASTINNPALTLLQKD